MKYSRPSISASAVSADSTNHGSNISEKKINPESSKKQNLNLPCAGNYLHGVYVVFPTMHIALTFY